MYKLVFVLDSDLDSDSTTLQCLAPSEVLLSNSNVPKSWLHVQSYYFAYQTYFFFNVVFTLSAVVAKKLPGESAVRRDLRILSHQGFIAKTRRVYNIELHIARERSTLNKILLSGKS